MRMLRLARWLFPGGNPLARGVDRVEGGMMVAAILVGLLLLPVMLVFGSLTYENINERGAAQARTRHKTVATLTADAPKGTVTSYGNTGKVLVPAVWQRPDGSLATGPVPAEYGLNKGATVEIWIDRDGRVVDAPTSSADAAFVAVVVAGWGWVAVLGVLALLLFGLHRVLDRRRFDAWERQWARVDREWNSR